MHETMVINRKINKDGRPVWVKALAVVLGIVAFLLAGAYSMAVRSGNDQTDAEYQALVDAEGEANEKYEREFHKPRATVAQDLALDKLREQYDTVRVDLETYKSTHLGVWKSLVRGGKIWASWFTAVNPVAFGVLVIALAGTAVVVWNLTRTRKPTQPPQPAFLTAQTTGPGIPTRTPAPSPASPRPERRSNHRVVRCMTANLVMDGGTTHLVSLGEMSQAGCFFETGLFFSKGERVVLRLCNGTTEEMEVTGEVVWVRREDASATRKPVGAGVKFLGLTEDMKDKLACLLAPKPPPLPPEEEVEGAGSGSSSRRA